MHKELLGRGVVQEVTRRRNDKDGNPRFRVTFTNGHVFPTENSAQFAFGITEDLVGKTVTYAVKGACIVRLVVEE